MTISFAQVVKAIGTAVTPLTFAASLAILVVAVPTCFAQSSDPLRSLIEQLNQSSIPGRQVLTAIPEASTSRRSDTTSKEGTPLTASPFHTATIPDFRPTPAGFSPIELTLIDQYCQGSIDARAERLLAANREFSSLERDYCRRANETTTQFGYDILDRPSLSDIGLKGAIRDDYVVGIGDEFIVTFSGQRRGSVRTRIDRSGRLVLPDLPPVSTSGATFGELRGRIELLVATQFISTDVYLSLGEVRQLSVLVVGEVRRPGVYVLSGLSNVIEALVSAGGVAKTGSLRGIQLQRGRSVAWIDLYDMFFSGGASLNLGLSDGDRIVVPTIGATVALAGDVKRKGIYELAEGAKSATFTELVNLAGGFLQPRANRFFHLTHDSAGKTQALDRQKEEFEVRNGDVVVILPAENIQLGTVELVGHVRTPGRRSLSVYPTIGALVRDRNVLRDDPYLLLAALQTTDLTTGARQFYPVNLQNIIERSQDFSLRDVDRLIILSGQDIRFLVSRTVQEIIAGLPRLESSDFDTRSSRGDKNAGTQTYAANPALREDQLARDTVAEVIVRKALGFPSNEGSEYKDGRGREKECRGVERLRSIVGVVRAGRFANAIQAISARRNDDRERAEGQQRAETCPEIFEKFPDLLPFLLEQVVAVNGELRRPGAYPVVKGTTLSALVAVAGSLTREADLTQVELLHFSADQQTGKAVADRQLLNLTSIDAATVGLEPGDVVRFNPVFANRDSGPVQISGEVQWPGFYEIRRGERISQIIARAGGLTRESFPYGAIFTRESVRLAEEAGLQRAAHELNVALTIAAAQKGLGSGALTGLSSLSQQLREVRAVGRVVAEIDPTVLQVRPELDTVLEPGDRLFIPKRPNSVLIIGDVLNPGAQQFIPGTAAEKYIKKAGGFQRSADQDRVFVVLPNGEAQPLSVSAFNFTPVQIPPGSAVVVPKEPAPLDLLTLAKDVGGLISQLAIAAASLAVITRN
ncbi:MAG: hypothetical protein EXQ91_00210 [Alphaproteobacteria bacterium]|nr:hypothetical protein [Alphaproteobacteria bacterium]